MVQKFQQINHSSIVSSDLPLMEKMLNIQANSRCKGKMGCLSIDTKSFLPVRKSAGFENHLFSRLAVFPFLYVA
jgi:hypothetical protein